MKLERVKEKNFKFKIRTLNYDIYFKNKISACLFSLTQYTFKGSTSIFFSIFNLFFRSSIYLKINSTFYHWHIDTLSDFRLLRGDFNSTLGKYQSEIGYEGIDLYFVKNLLVNGDIVIDIGANKGFYTLFFSTFVGNDGKVIAFEAYYKNFSFLFQRIISRWNLINVIPFNFILGDNNSSSVSMKKPFFFDDGTGLFFQKSQVKNSIYQRKVDSILDCFNFKAIKLIKIDVEGGEFEVLKGCTNVIEITDYLLIEISDASTKRFGNTIQDIYSFLSERKFIYNYSISLNAFNKTELITDGRNYGNILFSKKPLLV